MVEVGETAGTDREVEGLESEGKTVIAGSLAVVPIA